ncbi:MAG: hypothetical protein VX871_04580, partial [Pseudomonadota bacterium]|nr:hypothetical protein [Pseudomonadota bacterium]
MIRSLQILRVGANAMFWVLGLGLCVYLAFAAFGYLRNSSEHYSNFLFCVLGMSGFLTLHEFAERRLSEPESGTPLFWVKFALAGVATLAALV